MSDVTPISLSSPQTLAMALAETDRSDTVSLVELSVKTDGTVLIAHSKMSTERLLMMGSKLVQYALGK